MPYKINAIGKSVLLISDTHIPYSHPDYLVFLASIKKIYKPDIIIHGGDEVDCHAISFHDSDSSLLNADAELDRAIEELQDGMHMMFPKMYLLESNHGSLIYRKMKSNGLPIRHLKPLPELYGTPKWSWHEDILLLTEQGPTYICHGKTSAYGKLCKEMMTNAIQFHFHGKAEITYHKSVMGTRYNMYCGCLVDETSMAMAYARNNLPKAVHAVGFINQLGNPYLIRMNLKADGRWDGKL